MSNPDVERLRAAEAVVIAARNDGRPLTLRENQQVIAALCLGCTLARTVETQAERIREYGQGPGRLDRPDRVPAVGGR